MIDWSVNCRRSPNARLLPPLLPGLHLKAAFASAAVALACFQIFSGTWIYGKLRWRKPVWVNPAHRWSGHLAFVFTVPVAYRCIFKLGSPA
ncbi:MAG: hypothetical protein H0W90_05160 [Actinobacteria bacterium]|nr:hypothetical protein [Actinomycetota bacterium]